MGIMELLSLMLVQSTLDYPNLMVPCSFVRIIEKFGSPNLDPGVAGVQNVGMKFSHITIEGDCV